MSSQKKLTTVYQSPSSDLSAHATCQLFTEHDDSLRLRTASDLTFWFSQQSFLFPNFFHFLANEISYVNFPIC